MNFIQTVIGWDIEIFTFIAERAGMFWALVVVKVAAGVWAILVWELLRKLRRRYVERCQSHLYDPKAKQYLHGAAKVTSIHSRKPLTIRIKQ